MNPLFLAHIIADFLIQPTWLVRWKERSFNGVMVHAVIHALTLFVLLIPNTLSAAAILLGVAALHAVIDQTKVKYQKHHVAFGIPFLVDQCAHFIVLVCAYVLLPFPPAFWSTSSGYGMGVLLFMYSFSIAWFNLLRNVPHEQKINRSMLIVLVFLLYLTPALLLARSLYS